MADFKTVKLEGLLSTVNSSTTPLAGGGVFTGTAVEILNCGIIFVSVSTDKNSAIDGLCIEQSQDGTNWDDNDDYTIYANRPKNYAVNPHSRYLRVVYTNGSEAQTFFRLQTIIKGENAHPSSHSISGMISPDDDATLSKAVLTGEDFEGIFRNVKATEHGSLAMNLVDQYEFVSENTPMGEVRAISPFRLVGSSFIGTTLDTNFWSPTVTNGGTVTQASGQVLLQTNTTANGTTKLSSIRRARYIGGAALRFRTSIQLTDGETGTANNIRRWGAYDTNDGAFFELNGTTLNIVTRKATTDVPVASGSWNGASFTMDLNVHTYEIYWTNSSVWFVIDDNVVHKVTASTATWSSTVSLPITVENINTNGITNNIQMAMRVGTIYRLGGFETQSISYRQSGTTAGVVLKYGAGNIHGLIISSILNNANITLYDNTAASGTIIWSSGAMANNTMPFDLEFHTIPFSTGLTLVISGANCDVAVIYE